MTQCGQCRIYTHAPKACILHGPRLGPSTLCHACELTNGLLMIVKGPTRGGLQGPACVCNLHLELPLGPFPVCETCDTAKPLADMAMCAIHDEWICRPGML